MNEADFTEKLFYRIGEVSRICGVKPYVLRYWETEFHAIRPEKSGSGQRIYQRSQLDAVIQIKRLLYEKKYTIAGAKRALKNIAPEGEPDNAGAADAESRSGATTLHETLEELKAIREILKEGVRP